MTREEEERLWSDPNNWKYGFIYYCKADPRLSVPKKIRSMGTTFNFAHPYAIPLLILILLPIVLIFGGIFFVILLGMIGGLLKPQ